MIIFFLIHCPPVNFFQKVIKIRVLKSIFTCRVATASPSDPVYVATQKMRDLQVNSVVITAGNSLLGIFT